MTELTFDDVFKTTNLNIEAEFFSLLDRGYAHHPKTQAPGTKTCIFLSVAAVTEAYLLGRDTAVDLKIDATGINTFLASHRNMIITTKYIYKPKDAADYITHRLAEARIPFSVRVENFLPTAENGGLTTKNIKNLLRYGPVVVAVRYNPEWRKFTSTCVSVVPKMPQKLVEEAESDASYATHAVTIMGWHKKCWIIADKSVAWGCNGIAYLPIKTEYKVSLPVFHVVVIQQ